MKRACWLQRLWTERRGRESWWGTEGRQRGQRGGGGGEGEVFILSLKQKIKKIYVFGKFFKKIFIIILKNLYK